MRSLIIHMSSSGARRENALLAASETLDRPVDTFLQMHFAVALGHRPTGAHDSAQWRSGAGQGTWRLDHPGETRASAKLAREIKRAWYRARISLRPQKL